MSDYYAILVNLPNAPKGNAHLDVSIDGTLTAGQPVPVTYDVYRAADGVPLAEFQVNTANNYASNTMAAAPNNNLFAVSGQQSALVRARTPTPQGVSSSNGVLIQRVQGAGKIILGVPPMLNSNGTSLQGGTRIPVAVGDLMAGTYLFIANLSGQNQSVDVFLGTQGAIGTGKYKNPQFPPNGVWQVQLQPGDGKQHVIICGTGTVMAELAVDDGAKVDVAMLLPA
jgi:hypothetical protein